MSNTVIELNTAAADLIAWLDCCGIESHFVENVRAKLVDQPAPVQQEPVGYFSVNQYGQWEENESEYGQPFYASLPAEQAVPDAIHHTCTSESLEYITGWNDCRQAMLAKQPAPAAPVQDRNPYAWHYKNTGGASVWHFGPSNKLDADLEAAKKWPRTHQVTPVFTEQRTQQDCAELEELGWQAVCCPSCGNAGAKGYPRKLTPSLNQLPCGYEHHERRPYGAPGEVRIHAVLASQFMMPDGTIAPDYKWLIDSYKADPNTIKLLPLHTSPQAPKENQS